MEHRDVLIRFSFSIDVTSLLRTDKSIYKCTLSILFQSQVAQQLKRMWSKDILRKVKKALSSYFICSNEDKFDDDFLRVLQIYFLFGFYHPTWSKNRIIYGTFMFIFICITVVLGGLKSIFDSWANRSMRQLLLDVPITVYTVLFIAQLVTFIAKQGQIIDFLKVLHESNNEQLIQSYREKCSKLVKFYTIFLQIAVSSVVTFYFSGFKIFTFPIPALYDELANGDFFYLLLVINIIQYYSATTCFVPSDLLHVLCIVRVGANLELL